jgi:hypothetical protein
MGIPVNKNNEEIGGINPQKLNLLLAVVFTICGVLAGYFTMVYGIKMDLVGKADNEALVNLEKRVLSLEIYLKKSMLTKDDLILLMGAPGNCKAKSDDNTRATD